MLAYHRSYSKKFYLLIFRINMAKLGVSVSGSGVAGGQNHDVLCCHFSFKLPVQKKPTSMINVLFLPIFHPYLIPRFIINQGPFDKTLKTFWEFPSCLFFYVLPCWVETSFASVFHFSFPVLEPPFFLIFIYRTLYLQPEKEKKVTHAEKLNNI